MAFYAQYHYGVRISICTPDSGADYPVKRESLDSLLENCNNSAAFATAAKSFFI